MIPIVSLANFVSFLISLVLTTKLFVSYRDNAIPTIKYFFWCFALITIFFFLLATPGIFSSNGKLLEFSNLSAGLLAIPGVMFFTLIPMRLFRWQLLRSIYIVITICFAIATTIIRLFGLESLYSVQRGNFEFWLRPDNTYVVISWSLTGFFIFSSLLFASITFLAYGIKNKENRYIKIRSLILGVATFLLAITAATNYILGATPSIFAYLTSSILAVVALILLGIGIFYKQRESN